MKKNIVFLLLFVFIFVFCKNTKNESKYETLNDSSSTSHIYSAASSKEDTNRLNNKINIDINQLLGIWYYPEDINATFKIVKDSMFYVDANEWYQYKLKGETLIIYYDYNYTDTSLCEIKNDKLILKGKFGIDTFERFNK
ncbi:MAG TPA: hypothetical protein PKJ07_04890 [Bacteroidales bacterium]|jgi:hypothetical protein|nr:hypothetical protein [Bacteroidales bacterium]MDD3756424.1 hypothetical protein [Bacteroidales bacterium]MDY0401151.1 hypothetical protein [Bacteroidales bacterium]HOB27458.1 hypothetical protein [Bacteroidales bacterium]HOJ25016.1 hypothetical protein [Bacteroidales bacterium]